MFYCDNNQDKFRKAMEAARLVEMPFRFDFDGTKGNIQLEIDGEKLVINRKKEKENEKPDQHKLYRQLHQ